MTTRRAVLRGLAAGIATVPLGVARARDQVDVALAARVKAAYLVNFVRYCEWSTPGKPGDAWIVTVVGRSGLGRTIDRELAAAPVIQGKPIAVKRVRYPETAEDGSVDPGAFERFWGELASSHLAWVGRSEQHRVDEIVGRIAAGVLTVSDIRGFAARGGMIELVLSGEHIVFEANPAAMAAAGIRMSSKALALARALHGEVQR